MTNLEKQSTSLLEICINIPELAMYSIISLCRELNRNPTFTVENLATVNPEDTFTVNMSNDGSEITINVINETAVPTVKITKEHIMEEDYIVPVELGIILGKIQAVSATRTSDYLKDVQKLLKYVKLLHSLLDEADGEDAFGTEGWRHRCE